MLSSVLIRSRVDGGSRSVASSSASATPGAQTAPSPAVNEQRTMPAARAAEEGASASPNYSASAGQTSGSSAVRVPGAGGAYRESIEAKAFPPALTFPKTREPMLRTAEAETSSAAPDAGEEDEDEDADAHRAQAQDGILQESGALPTQDRSEPLGGERKPREERLRRARPFNGDIRTLPFRRPWKRDRPEREGPEPNPGVRGDASIGADLPERVAPGGTPVQSAPAPAPTASFLGLDAANWGSGYPPDTVGDVGPNHYIQSINSSVGIYRKSDGVRLAAFTLDTLMSQGAFGNLCDTENFGDPVVLYDTFEDRWVITDFAFQLSGGSVVNPPGAFQCFAVSKSGDPVTGGWNFYSINTANGLGDYPKFGIWPDGLYMTTSMFAYMPGGAFQNPRFYAFNKAQMYAGAPTVQVVSFEGPANDFTILPSNARLQTGTPPAGTPNYYVSTWRFLDALTVYKFHVDWNRPALSSFTGPETPGSASSWPNQSVANAPEQGGNSLDTLQIRAMMQNQYSNIGGAESLWDTHTVRRALGGFAAPRWYQLDVTGGVVNPNIAQAATFDPDAANVIHRFMPSLAVDRAGNLALGYSTSSSTTKPAIKYAGRLSTDPANTLPQTEQVLIQGTGAQTVTNRWGDYAAMSLDPNGCTFWFTTEYYAADGGDYQTRIGAFAFPQCTPAGSGGTLSGTVTDGATGAPIVGATVTVGVRTATTNAVGVYTLSSLPAGTYPTAVAAAAGYGSTSATGVVVNDGATTTKNFALAAGQASACLTDTTLSDFLTVVPRNIDVVAVDGAAVLSKPSLDQFNVNYANSGAGFNATTWAGQTFTPSVSGQLKSADMRLFCSGCAGTTPNLTVSVRATAAGLPVGVDLATATIPGFNSGSAAFYAATFAAPPTLSAGTQYALLVRPNANPSAGTYAAVLSVTSGGQGFDTYPGGTFVSGATAGTVWSIPTAGGSTMDTAFHTYMDSGYAGAGDFISALRDANPPANSVAHWTTLSWGALTPGGTSVKFQVAASNSASGPFNFVGPDGTAATYFTVSGSSLAQFNGFRYLKYKAYLATPDGATTPTVTDVTACFLNVVPTVTAATLSRPQGSAVVNTQIGTVSDPAHAANTLTVTATPLTGTGVTVNNITVDAAGNVKANVATSCSATTSTFTLKATDPEGANASATLVVNVTANTGPALSYNSASVNITQGATINPVGALTDNGSVASVVVQSVGTYTGGISVSAAGVVTLTNAAPVGTHAIVIRATDDCGTITDAGFNLTVSKFDTTTTLTTSAAAATAGQSVTFTATVTAATGTPTGSVQFKDGGTNLGSPVALNASGVATFTTSALTPGAHTITADYLGDANYNTSSGALASAQTVGSVFSFSQSSYTVAERGGSPATITVTRAGTTAQAASVFYVTDDNSLPTVFVPCSATSGQASERCDYERASGTLQFAAGETSKTFEVLINDDAYTEGTESLALRFNTPSAGSGFGTIAVATLQITDDATEPATNPIDADADFFVRQHYRDFLNREADASGLAFWTNEITSCGADAQCREVKRINVSAAFFLSIEFQQTGYFVYRMDKAAFGDISAAVPVPVRIDEFLRDTQSIQRGIIVGQGPWQQQLEAAKAAYALAFVQREAFTSRYAASMTAADFVNQLDFFAGGVLSASEKTALVSELSPNPSDAGLRASVLRKVADDADLVSKESNRAFVLMQYFGYLRRDPDSAPNTNFDGFNFWLGKLNQFNGNYIQAELVKAFITSDEYRKRFGQ